MKPLAFSTNAFKKNTLAEAIDSIANIGYRGVELMADLHHANPATFGAEAREKTKRQLAARGLTVSNVNAFTYFCDGDTYHPTWIEDDQALIEKRVKHTIGAMEIAAEFGARTVSLQPGGPMIGTKLARDDASERFAVGLNRVLPVAREHNIILAIEPEPGLFIQTAAEFIEFRDRHFKTEPLIQMNCDIGHLFCVGDDPAQVIRDHAKYIAHVHLEDIGKNRVHQHLTPGKGVIDFEEVFESLDAISYSGPVTVELYPYETTAAGVAKMAWEHLKPMLEDARRCYDSGMQRASDGLWNLARNRVYIDAAELAHEIEAALSQSDELDHRSRLLIRDSLRALEHQWGQKRLEGWIARSELSDEIQQISDSREFDDETGFPSLPSRIMEPIKTDTVIRFFQELSHHVTRPTTLYVGGSIALMLAGRLSRSTDDVDVVDEVPQEIRDQHPLRDELAKRFGLHLAHFQSHYLPDGWRNRVRSFDVVGNLQIFLVDPYDVILGKLFSSRTKDKDDLAALASEIDRDTLKRRLIEAGAALLADQKFQDAAQRNWFTLFGEALPTG